MNDDERAIRELIASWLKASAAHDLDTVLGLMSDDIVFLTPGQKPYGKETFADVSRASQGKVRIEARSEVQEVQIAGDIAHCRTHLNVTATPTQGGESKRLSGYSLSILRKQADGKWLMVRDANLLTPELPRKSIQAAVPVLQVASVAKSIEWYRKVLGFAADPFGPPEAPVFAILNRDGVELMLQNACGLAGKRQPGSAERGWDVYIRVADIQNTREKVRAIQPDVEPIAAKEYGCQEFTILDPDGYLIVIGQCG